MARLGAVLFSQHLISVELGGTLLLAALVGAVAIAIQGKRRLETQIEEATR
jgi:NADH:ubiquinone oxidoreductase subunit 6 (subunit J)